jgi:OFA family oxalate/formate antiporter-like MFS transporter
MEQKVQNRLIPVLAAIAIQMCLGVAYLWSIFQNGIAKTIFNGDNAAAALTFSLLLATLTIGSVIGGKLASKYSIQSIIIIGGVILSAGFFLASYSTPQTPWLLWVTYGVMGGVGMGFTYSTTIAVAQKWFPEKKGLVTGLIVSALGFGGVVFTPIIEGLLKNFGGVGVGELQTFKVLSLIFIIVCTICGLFIKNPPEGFCPKGYIPPEVKAGNAVIEYSPIKVLKMPQFYFVTLTLMLACMGGLMMIGFAKPIAIAKGLSSTATVGVYVISMFNSAGRLFWGYISDKLGRKNTIILLLSATAVLSLLVNLATGYWIYGLIALIGFSYGGFLSTFPSLTSDLFGPKHMATNYGMVLIGFGIGAILSSNIAGHYKNIANQTKDINSMFPAFIIASIAAILGIGLMLLLKPKQAK